SLLQPSFKLPWSSGSSYCVTRTGSGNGFTFPATCGTTICGSYSGDHGYEAIDFNLGLNTTVLAAAGGTVVFAWFNATGTDPITGGYGNLVKIRHSDGTYA
ncbi:MAG: M23 family metallopeptidase, partial [Blastocatellia bacterium]